MAKKNYQVCAVMTVSCWTMVEASSPEEAMKLAARRDVADHQIDGGWPDDEHWHFDNDGTPTEIKIEETP